MSVSKAIASHIPYLRRFARALTGNQASGDAYVLATLEAIVGDPDGFDPGPDARTALYRTFLKVWGTMPVNTHVDQSGLSPDEYGARRNLDAITLRPRIAFLLSALEGFDCGETARVLECNAGEAARLIDEASKEIANQIQTDVLIIEDEPFIALDLQTLVEELGHRVAGVARTHQEAVDAVGKQRPGLILADIQLADGSSGLEAVNQILGSFCPGHFHHRLSRAFPDRCADKARLPDHQAFWRQQPQSCRQPGPVLRSPLASQGRA